MPIKKASRMEIVVARVLEQMPGARWAQLRGILANQGLRALIAATTLEETRAIQDKVLELRDPHHEAIPLFLRLQQAFKTGLEQATFLPWPALYQESFDA